MAEEDMKIAEVCSVEPPSSAAAPMSLPLTFFDIRWLRFPPLECLFFYQYPHPPSSFFHHLLPKLKHSFSLTLQHYLPLAGNLTWPHRSPYPTVDYFPGDSVSFTVAQSQSSFSHLSSSNLREASKLHLLTPRLDVSQEHASVMALQVTLFPNSGFSLGISIHHAVMDGKSAMSVMKLWAYFCSKSDLEEEAASLVVPQQLLPFYDRTMIRDPIGISERFVNEVLNDGGVQNNRSLMLWNWDHKVPSEAVRGTFGLTRAHIEILKKYAQSKLKNNGHVSTFSVTYAYMGRCLVKTEQTKSEKVNFGFAVDCRGRLEPPTPSTYFGNCLVGQSAITETKTLLENELGLVNAVEELSEAVKRLEIGLVRGADSWGSRKTMGARGNNTKVLSISGSTRFEVYSVDFGWGRPVKVDIVSIDKTRAFSISESRNGDGGVEIGLVLNRYDMEAFGNVFGKDLEALTSSESQW
ncbi:malonyl-CoA:anthocyanidin 5-O-glucoside-6''-O-malonyltransferase-like [Neltuma alba]|uniref:malonyl-CoA:anthocyanidin 5-O-glucoside-6''-O-malonyltransferase-like n=1 Tax=Neltuma alba TaxID=207710 RepID=UPI0010A2F38C|nr:malonyl-CoA:anthocyanidin 5-O-glucoside-6''-O-malonyltransferase-like [Prosopis alba]